MPEDTHQPTKEEIHQAAVRVLVETRPALEALYEYEPGPFTAPKPVKLTHAGGEVGEVAVLTDAGRQLVDATIERACGSQLYLDEMTADAPAFLGQDAHDATFAVQQFGALVAVALNGLDAVPVHPTVSHPEIAGHLLRLSKGLLERLSAAYGGHAQDEPERGTGDDAPEEGADRLAHLALDTLRAAWATIAGEGDAGCFSMMEDRVERLTQHLWAVQGSDVDRGAPFDDPLWELPVIMLAMQAGAGHDSPVVQGCDPQPLEKDPARLTHDSAWQWICIRTVTNCRALLKLARDLGVAWVTDEMMEQQ